MNDKIHIFNNVNEAIETLRIYGASFTPKINHFDKELIIKKSVDSSVYRAFKSLPIKPSEIYRPWLSNHFDGIISKSNQINNYLDYEVLLTELTQSLLNHWKEAVHDPNLYMQYGPASKIINLIFKMIQESDLYRNEKIQKYLHVPFDEYSLKPLLLIINHLTDVNYKISIPPNPSMKFITNPELYRTMQKAVSSLCQRAGIFPIIYDYWSWNENHKIE